MGWPYPCLGEHPDSDRRAEQRHHQRDRGGDEKRLHWAFSFTGSGGHQQVLGRHAFQPGGPGGLDENDVTAGQAAAECGGGGRAIRHTDRLTVPSARGQGAVEDRCCLFPDNDQTGHSGSGRQRTDLLVAGPGLIAQLGHLAEYGEGAPAPGHVAQRLQRRPDRFGVGVVGVIDHGDAARGLADLHPPPAAGGGRGQTAGDVRQAEAHLGGDGRGGQGVRHVMRAVQGQPDRGRPGRGRQREARAAQVVQAERRRR